MIQRMIIQKLLLLGLAAGISTNTSDLLLTNESNHSCGKFFAACGAPHFGVIVQMACDGSSWFGDLLDAEPCSLGFRHGGEHRDGAFRGDGFDLAQLYPLSREEALQTPGAAASQGVMLMASGTKRLKTSTDFLVKHALPAGIEMAVLVQFRDAIFIALCQLKKLAVNKLRNRTPARAWDGCDTNHMTADTCPLAKNFSFSVDANELHDAWQKVKHNQQLGREAAEKIARRHGTSVVDVLWRDIYCGKAVPPVARVALGFEPECPDGRRPQQQNEPQEEKEQQRRKLGELLIAKLATEKLTPPNPFAGVVNRGALAGHFAFRNLPAEAAAIRRPAEVSCLDWVQGGFAT